MTFVEGVIAEVAALEAEVEELTKTLRLKKKQLTYLKLFTDELEQRQKEDEND